MRSGVLLVLIAAGLVALLVVTIVPGPFTRCQTVDMSPRGGIYWPDVVAGRPEADHIRICDPAWWPG